MRKMLAYRGDVFRELACRGIAMVTAEGGYAYTMVCNALRRRGFAALIPVRKETLRN